MTTATPNPPNFVERLRGHAAFLASNYNELTAAEAQVLVRAIESAADYVEAWIASSTRPSAEEPIMDNFDEPLRELCFNYRNAATIHAEEEFQKIVRWARTIHPAMPRHALHMPSELHPETRSLVKRFAEALAQKLHSAEKKYGYSDGWAGDDWMAECQARLLEHVAKGDPRDVAAYCAFLWHHGWSTQSATEPNLPRDVSDFITHWR